MNSITIRNKKLYYTLFKRNSLNRTISERKTMENIEGLEELTIKESLKQIKDKNINNFYLYDLENILFSTNLSCKEFDNSIYFGLMSIA